MCPDCPSPPCGRQLLAVPRQGHRGQQQAPSSQSSASTRLTPARTAAAWQVCMVGARRVSSRICAASRALESITNCLHPEKLSLSVRSDGYVIAQAVPCHHQAGLAGVPASQAIDVFVAAVDGALCSTAFRVLWLCPTWPARQTSCGCSDTTMEYEAAVARCVVLFDPDVYLYRRISSCTRDTGLDHPGNTLGCQPSRLRAKAAGSDYFGRIISVVEFPLIAVEEATLKCPARNSLHRRRLPQKLLR